MEDIVTVPSFLSSNVDFRFKNSKGNSESKEECGR
jgi:hypothetical protein